MNHRLSWGRVFQAEKSQCKGPEVRCGGLLEKHTCGSKVHKRKSGRRCSGGSSEARGCMVLESTPMSLTFILDEMESQWKILRWAMAMTWLIVKYKGLLCLLYQEFSVEEQGMEAGR